MTFPPPTAVALTTSRAAPKNNTCHSFLAQRRVVVGRLLASYRFARKADPSSILAPFAAPQRLITIQPGTTRLPRRLA